MSHFEENFLHEMTVLRSLPKQKCLGLVLVHIFCMIFSMKMFLIQKSIYGQSFNVIPCSSSRYQTKCVIKFLFRQFMMSYALKQ